MEQYLTFNNISKKFNQQLALNNLNCHFRKGRCTGLIGANGAGKTTALKILVGLITANTGEIKLREQIINPQSTAYKKRFGYLSQFPRFYDWMSGKEFLDFTADLYKLPTELKQERVNEMLTTFGLEKEYNKKIGNYSGGMKQRLGIAQAFIHKPELLILDEPVSSLDPEGRYQIIKLLQELKNKTTIILSTHILNDAEDLCDDIIILNQGQKIIEDEIVNLIQEYMEPVIRVNLLNVVPNIAERVAEATWAESVNLDENKLIVSVNNQDEALRKLPALLIDYDTTFSSFSIEEPKLEDIFLRVVKK